MKLYFLYLQHHYQRCQKMVIYFAIVAQTGTDLKIGQVTQMLPKVQNTEDVWSEMSAMFGP